MRSTLILAGCVLVAGATQAQTVDHQDLQAKTSPEDPVTIEDIVVTATRREERLQNVPVTVTAISGDSLTAAGVSDTTHLTQLVPGVISGGRTNSFFTPTIRGVTTTTTTNESPVAFYVDGIYQPYSAAGAMKLASIARVEVLRGPQGTLFGRNSTAGLINVITKDPSHDLAGNVELTYASFDQRTINGYVTGGLTDTLAGDFAIYRTDSDGYVKDLVRGGTIDGDHTLVTRSKWKWTPTDNFDVTLTGAYTYSRNDTLTAFQPWRNYSVGYYVSPDAVKTTGSNQYVGDVLPETWLRQLTTNVQARWDAGPVQLYSSTSYEKDSNVAFWDSDSSPIPVRGSIRQSSPARFITQEFRAVSDYDSALSWVAGVYLFSLERRLDPLDIENFPPATVTIPFPNTPLRIARSSTLINPLNRGFSYAPFGQAKLRLADKFSVLAGLRYTWERQKLDQNINGSTFNASAVFKNVSPMASLQYEPNDHINLYATYSTGFKSGVFNSAGGVSPGSTTQTPVKPEEIKNFELGLKSDVTAQLRVNTSVFHFRYTNQQVQVRQPNGVAVFINAGKSTVNGAETEITLRPSSEITVRATAAYLDAKYDSFPSAPVFVPTIIDGIPAGLDLITADNAGKHMIRAPKFTFGIAPEFHTPLGSGTLTVSGNAFHSSRYYFDSANLIPQPAYWNLNAKISCGFADDKVVVALFGTNLTQSDVLVAAAQGQFTVQAAYDSPRIIGVSIGTQF